MRVLMIGSHLRVNGGITRVVKNYIEAGLPEKVNFEYFPTYFGANLFINIFYFYYQLIRLHFKLLFKANRYDVAHIHMSYRGSFIRKRIIINLLNKKKIPIVLHMHGSQFKDFYSESTEKGQKKIRDTLNKVNIIIALGGNWQNYYKSITKVKVVSVDNAVFPKPDNKENHEKIYITTMGILSKRKGTYDLIEAAIKVKDKIDPKYKFLIAGDGEVEKVKRRINDLKLNKMFEIPGWISDSNIIEDIYKKSIIYILPSYNEGMPMSILEAMSYGLPVISTEVGSIPSVVEEKNGILIKPGNVDELAESIITLLNNKDKLKEISFNNSEKILHEYNIYSSINEITDLYESLK